MLGLMWLNLVMKACLHQSTNNSLPRTMMNGIHSFDHGRSRAVVKEFVCSIRFRKRIKVSRRDK